MSLFAFLLLCVQACLIQNVYSECRGAGLGLGWTGLGFGYGLAAPEVFAGPAYGGSGVGDIAIAGEMGVAGTTLVEGQVLIPGAVRRRCPG
ncbi:chorion class A protein Ld2/Ld41-like [Battus philenor]|uniref:chorion class A protein Ld2/Ld41-like n=1 Tax=Battus philenor TaxID=42288 RepID=UPI0035CF528E